MRIVEPFTLQDANLLSSNVAENDHAAYAAGTSYDTGDRVIIAANNIHKIFESLEDTNQGNDPLDADNADKWLDLGPTNRWKMFDEKTGTATENADSIEIQIETNEFTNAVVIMNASAATVEVVVNVGDTDEEVYRQEKSLVSNSDISNWYDYFFTQIDRIKDVVFIDLPAYLTKKITVTLTETGQTVSCGAVVFGTQKIIGNTSYGTGSGILDFSVKRTDDFGNFRILERAFSKRSDYSVQVATARVASIQNILANLRATPVVFIGNPELESTIVYGYYRDFDLLFSGPVNSDLSISVEGLN